MLRPFGLHRTAAMFLLAALGAGAAMAFLTAWIIAGILEARTLSSIQVAYAAAGLDWARIDTDGLRVNISGTAPSEGDRMHAAEIAGRLISADRIETSMLIAPPPVVEDEMPPAGLELLRDGRSVTMTGVIPGTVTRLLIERTLEDLDIDDTSESTEAAPPEHWSRLLPLALDAATMLPRVQIRLGECELWLSGAARSQAERDRIRAMLAQESQCEITHDIFAPRPLVSPYRFELGLADRTAVLPACTARNEADASQIRTALDGLTIAGGVECIEALGAPSAEWSDAVTAAIKTLRDLGTGRLSVSDTEIQLSAPSSVPQDEFESATTRLASALPAGFSLQSQRREPGEDAYSMADPDERGGWFRAERSADGSARLAGRLRHPAARQAVDSYAASLFGTAGLGNETLVDQTLPEGWTARVMAGLDALAITNEGRLSITETSIKLTGSSGDPDAEALVRRILERVSGVETELTLSVSYDPRIAAAAAAPEPASCLSEIQIVLTKDQIVFASSSSRIEEESFPVLDSIAEVMRRCVTSSFEIGGYTDNSGRSQRNLELSAQRAEAVVDALLARGVDLDRMTAQGYGEANPIADNETETGRAANRRIEVKLQVVAPLPAETADRPAEPFADTPHTAAAETVEEPAAVPAEPVAPSATAEPAREAALPELDGRDAARTERAADDPAEAAAPDTATSDPTALASEPVLPSAGTAPVRETGTPAIKPGPELAATRTAPSLPATPPGDLAPSAAVTESTLTETTATETAAGTEEPALRSAEATLQSGPPPRPGSEDEGVFRPRRRPGSEPPAETPAATAAEASPGSEEETAAGTEVTSRADAETDAETDLAALEPAATEPGARDTTEAVAPVDGVEAEGDVLPPTAQAVRKSSRPRERPRDR